MTETPRTLTGTTYVQRTTAQGPDIYVPGDALAPRVRGSLLGPAVGHLLRTKLTNALDAVTAAEASTDPAVAQRHRGVAVAEADIYLTLTGGDGTARDRSTEATAVAFLQTLDALPSLPGPVARLDADLADWVARYALQQATAAHLDRVERPRHDPERERLAGLRDAYAVSYAQLMLRAADHPDASVIAGRITSALRGGVVDLAGLFSAAWAAPRVAAAA